MTDGPTHDMNELEAGAWWRSARAAWEPTTRRAMLRGATWSALGFLALVILTSCGGDDEGEEDDD